MTGEGLYRISRIGKEEELKRRRKVMQTITAGGRSPYQIHVGSGILKELPHILGEALKAGTFRETRAHIVTDRNVARHHLHPLTSALKRAGFSVSKTVFPAGERLKRHAALHRLLRNMVKQGLTRDSTVIALGGGVIGDFAGFAASVYMRGCHLVQVPTSLLAQVDSSIGGKVGINLPEGKNLVGSFYNPLFALSDTDTLCTLPHREFSSGLAEIVKYGLIGDDKLFARIEGFFSAYLREGTDRLTTKMIQTSILKDREFLNGLILDSTRIKVEIVQADEHEQGLRMLLNFGHTFGHALEQVTGYRRYLHGEVIFLGMRMAALLSASLGLIKKEDLRRITQLLTLFPIPRVKGPSSKKLHAAMGYDKKKRGGSVHYVVLERIGKAVTKTGIPEKLVRESIESVIHG
jgi:3-dehydroquinate synthase